MALKKINAFIINYLNFSSSVSKSNLANLRKQIQTTMMTPAKKNVSVAAITMVSTSSAIVDKNSFKVVGSFLFFLVFKFNSEDFLLIWIFLSFSSCCL